MSLLKSNENNIRCSSWEGFKFKYCFPSGNASSSRTAGDSLISKQRKHKRKSTLIPRIDNDALQSMAAANINAEEVKATGVELLNKGLLLEIHIPELSDLLTFIRHLDKDVSVKHK